MVWVNKLGPNHNPQETYRYDSLPFCKPAEKVLAYKSDSMGSLLEGNELTGFDNRMPFRCRNASLTVCFPIRQRHCCSVQAEPEVVDDMRAGSVAAAYSDVVRERRPEELLVPDVHR